LNGQHGNEILSQLSKELTPELLEAECVLLSKVLFTQGKAQGSTSPSKTIENRLVTQKQFNPLNWYTATPSETD